jgi:tetratricopeptide (TPR) repeat protein
MLYDGLNLYRELIVEQNLRVIFWLTTEEAVLLSQRSPDLWAFRHHTVEFNSSRSSVRNVLPSGALLWQASNGKLNLEEIREKIAAQEKLLQTISETGETLTTHTQVVVQLAYLHWLAGENAEVTRLVEHELQKTALANMDDIHALVCNAQAINCYDQKQYKDALQWIEKALEANPNLSLLWSNHGLICRSAGQSRKSFSSIKKAVRLNPSAPENWEMLGYIYASVGKFAAALSAFEQAQTLRSDKDHLNPILAFCHHRIGNLGKFRRLVQLITDTSGDNEYLIICRDGLREDKSAALKRLGAWAQEEKIPQALIRRDVQLHFILGIPS